MKSGLLLKACDGQKTRVPLSITDKTEVHKTEVHNKSYYLDQGELLAVSPGTRLEMHICLVCLLDHLFRGSTIDVMQGTSMLIPTVNGERS